MEKIDRLVVTVGTSLFASASWEETGAFAEMKGYSRWCGKLLERPLERRASNPKLLGRIEEYLRKHESAARCAFAWPGRPLRYSAEISTLVNWQGKVGGRQELGAFLNGRYKRIDLVAPSDRDDPARLAADHLQGLLVDRIKADNVHVADVLTSPSIQDRVDHFQEYLRSLISAEERIDLVVSGGYKVFAMSAAVIASMPRLRGRWRLLYVHEDSYNELIVQAGDTSGVWLEIGNRKSKLTPAGTF